MSQQHSPEFRQKIVREARDTGNASLVARQHPLAASMVRRWGRESLKQAHVDIDTPSLVDKNVRLKQLLGERDLPLTLLQQLLQKRGLSVTELCEQIAVWHEDYPGVALTVLCPTVALPRGYSVTQSGTKISDGQLMEWIVDILETENAQYGYHKISWSLRRHYALVISFKQVYRLLKEMRLLWPQRPRKPQHPRRLARNCVFRSLLTGNPESREQQE